MSINFKNFAVRNGGCILEADMPLENQGLVLIQGVNNDEGGSNGSGKSTLFDLLASSATGRTGKSVGNKNLKKNDLLNLKNPKNFHTQLTFEKEGSEYIINTYRAHKDFGTRIEILIDGVDETPTTKLDDVQNTVSKILGFTPDEFYGQIYLSQQYSHALVHGTPAEKRKYLSLYFGLDSVDLMFDISKKRLNSIQIPNEAELIDLRDSVDQQLQLIPLEELVICAKQEAESLRQTSQQRLLELRYIIDNQQKAKKVEEQSKSWEVNLASLNVAFTLKDMQAQETSDGVKLESLKTEVKRLTELQEIESQLAGLGVTTELSYQEIRNQVSSYEKIIQAKTEDLSKVRIRTEKEKELAKLPKSDKDWRTLSLELTQVQREAKQYSNNLATLASEIQKLSFQGTSCPTCLRSITEEEHKNMLTTRQHAHQELKPVVEELLVNISNLQVLTQAKEKSLLIESEMVGLPAGDLDLIKAELSTLENTKRNLQQLADTLVRATSLQDRKAKLEEANPQLNISLLDIKPSITNLTERVFTIKRAREWLLQNGQIKFDMTALGLAQEELEIVEKQFTQANESALEQARLLTTRQQLSKQLTDVARILAKNSEEKRRKRILEVIHVTVNNVKKMQLKKATEVLTSVLPHYITQLFPESGVKVYTPEEASEFDLFLDKGDQHIPLYASSGGQAKRVALAIFFAFSQMGTKSSNILMTDEIFKDLDPKGREACYEVLRDLKVPSIFITSHDNDLQAKNKYDQIWQMVMHNDVSKLYR